MSNADLRALLAASKTVKEMLELGDGRLMACDGPCGGQLPQLDPDEWGKVYRACKKIIRITAALAEKACSADPNAPHGFDRNASHSENRYVCECEHYEANK